MTITGSPVSGNFNTYVFEFIRDGEGQSQRLYLDSLYHVPTIGYGFALAIYNAEAAPGYRYSLRSDLQDYFDGIHTFTTTENDFLDDLITDLNAGNFSTAENNVDDANGLSGDLWSTPILESGCRV